MILWSILICLKQKQIRINWKETRYVCTKRFGGDKYDTPQCIGMCCMENIDEI